MNLTDEQYATIMELGYMTPSQAALFRQCSRDTIRRKINEGELPVRWLDKRTPLISVEDACTVSIRGYYRD